MEFTCPVCGSVLMDSRQKLKCTNPDCAYQETCCEGGKCGCYEEGGMGLSRADDAEPGSGD